MDSFEINKIIAAILLTALIIIGIGKFTDILFHVEKPKESAYKIEGLEIGADDYLTKPFNPKELLLRVLSILKRSKSEENIDNEIFFGDYTLNIEKRELTKSNDRVYLTDREMNLLIALAKSPGQPLNREKLAGIDEPGRSVDVGINRLRRKIEKDPRMPLWLQTVRGEGYILRPDK